MGKCKSCVRRSVRENRRNRIEQYTEYERSRANLPHRIEARRKYHEEHKEEIAGHKKVWTKANADRTAASKRKHYELNREEVIARGEEWSKTNTEKVRQFKADNSRKRRAAKHASPGNFTAIEFRELCEQYGDRCLYISASTSARSVFKMSLRERSWSASPRTSRTRFSERPSDWSFLTRCRRSRSSAE